MSKTYMHFHIINRDGINGFVKVKDGITLETASPFKKDKTKTNPEELFALSWATCLNESLKFILTQHHYNLKSQVDVLVDLKIDKSSKTYFFDLNAYVSIESFDLEKTSEFMHLAHQRCAISKLIAKSETVKISAHIYGAPIL